MAGNPNRSEAIETAKKKRGRPPKVGDGLKKAASKVRETVSKVKDAVKDSEQPTATIDTSQTAQTLQTTQTTFNPTTNQFTHTSQTAQNTQTTQSAQLPTATSAAPKTAIQTKTHDLCGGIQVPVFEPNSYLAGDLFHLSSALPRTAKSEADRVVESIEEQRQTIRIVSANLDLNADVLKAGTKSEKMMQAGIDYGIAKVNTDTKSIDFQSALVSNEIAGTKLNQNREKLNHERVTLDGLRAETEQRQRFWQEKYQLGESRIKSVQLARYQLDMKIGSIDTESSVE